jgi:hypothetical protein
MLNKKFTRQIFLLLLIICLALPGASVRAQSQAFAAIAAPDFSKFPTITTRLDAFDDQGEFLSGLTPENVTMLENDQQIVPDSVQQLQVPLGVVVAINSGPGLAVRDGLGISRYEKVAAVISNWAGAHPTDSPDDWSLSWNGGIIASHFSPIAWKNRFDSFDPALRTSKPGLAALSFALDAAQNTQAVPGEKKALLLVSAHLESASLEGLKDLVTRAKNAEVHVHVWIVDSGANLTLPGALALQDLADQTGGRYLTFTGSETLPDPEAWLSSLRHIYQLSYTSRIKAAGRQSLSVQVKAAGLALTSRTASFELNIQPPNPALLSAPTRIERKNPDAPFDLETFLPRRQEISVLIEFTDKYPRKLVRTTFYVDGKKVAENTTEPFDKFSWDLSGYIVSADHALEVEAEDELGLTRRSASVPVQVIVVEPPGGIPGLMLRNGNAVVISMVVLAGAVLLVILFLGGRRRFASLSERNRRRVRDLDPVTQPIAAIVEPRGGPPRANPFPWLRRKNTSPPAYFVKLTADGQPMPGDPIALNNREMTFGTDPTQASIILDHPSVSPLHARLRMNENGGFQLVDQNSIAGTWVNFESISITGRILKHGDMVHFGQFTYRFVLSKPPISLKPTITPNVDG